MWLDLLLMLLAVSPLAPMNRFEWQDSESAVCREC